MLDVYDVIKWARKYAEEVFESVLANSEDEWEAYHKLDVICRKLEKDSVDVVEDNLYSYGRGFVARNMLLRVWDDLDDDLKEMAAQSFRAELYDLVAVLEEELEGKER